MAPGPMRNKRRSRDLCPVRMNDEAGDDVGEEYEREPLQNRCDLVIAKKYRRERDAGGEDNHKKM